LRRKLGLREEHGFVLRAVYKQGYQLISVQSRVSKPIPDRAALSDFTAGLGQASTSTGLQ
jgi:hypothetical protein